MPVVNGVGCSEYTQTKQEQFAGIFRANYNAWRGVLAKQRWFDGNYTYIDLNAGPGHHPEYGSGSPMIALEYLRQYGARYTAHLFERDVVNAQSLAALTDESKNEFVHACDHRFIDQFVGNGRPNKIPGLIYSDENGNPPPFEFLAQLSKTFTRMDILIYFSATNIKRVKQFTYTDLLNYVRPIERTRAVIREPMGKHQWSFLYMTNGPAIEWKREGFYDLRSKEGQAIFKRLNETKAGENAELQPTLL